MMKTALCLLLLGRVAVAAEPPTVAIVYFDYDGKDDELVTLRKGITQMLITDLAGGDGYKVVERARLQDALAELDLASTRKIDASSALKLGKLLQARFVVAGGYFVMGGTLRLDARIYETETTKVLKGVGASGKSDDFFALEQKLAADVDAVLLGAAAKAAREPAPKPKPRAALARSARGAVPLKAVVLYARGLEALDAKDLARARAHLDEVVKANPDFLLARHDLSDLAM
ncbi:MAG: hypothetical protein IAE78_28540 [Myxococcus sp.]|nr:hypothetical protein [Myxococcus sp.]